ncbi:MAG TPA: hypothetical protein VFJ94_04790 [Intrasporangium sp.]|uniref:hypothetical protein n=1 Tax=Intrasporangium sp. TaxID=1925024 RepID=UPI002D777EA0|nr:hypothetical protein [Intrasporangium sp.]HET7397818.1 hypothetical protein [Intrasporangium sp.]
MPASSLVFVVIVAIWAAYLLQHYVRRREDAAAIRSVDDFSDAMRVLEKRSALHLTDLRAPRAHSYAVTPRRPARPTVDVKRAAPSGSTPIAMPGTSPLAARRTGSAGAPDAAPDAGAHVASLRPSPAVTLGQRRLRAAVLLLGVLAVPVSIVLVVTRVLTWVAVPVGVALLAGVVGWLVRVAAADRARVSRGDWDRFAEAAGGTWVPGHDDTQVIRAAAATAAPAAVPAARAAASAAVPAAAPTAATARRAFAAYDLLADEATARRVTAGPAQPSRSAEEAQDAPAAHAPLPGTWQPVPVPRPTYTLKAKAQPRLTPGGIPADVFETPEFADEADELDDRALLARRAVSQ